MLRAAWQLLVAILSWLASAPFVYLGQRDPELVLVVGRRFSIFTDNTKYFFAHASSLRGKGGRTIYLTVDTALAREIESAGGEAVLHPSFRSFRLLLRCGALVTDVPEFGEKGIYQFSRGAKLIQLWHGAPLKKIELDVHGSRLLRLPRFVGGLVNLQKSLIGRYPRYDAVVATSEHIVDRCFRSAFSSNAFPVSGYARNDVLLTRQEGGGTSSKMLAINTDVSALAKVNAARAKGKKICLYVPTFRNSVSDPFKSVMPLARLSRFACDNNLLFVLKLHPYMADNCDVAGSSGVLVYDPIADVYPLMSGVDILITDYSSIYFDFLLLDRPVVFFNYDLQAYLAEERAMYFDYQEMTPGKKCDDYVALEQVVKKILADGMDDGMASERSRVRDLIHEHQDANSSERTWQLVRGVSR